MIDSPIAACWVRESTAFNARAKIRAIDVLPTPRVPQKRYACAVLPSDIALRRVFAIAS